MKNYTIDYVNDYGERVRKTVSAQDENDAKKKLNIFCGDYNEWNGDDRSVRINKNRGAWDW